MSEAVEITVRFTDEKDDKYLILEQFSENTSDLTAGDMAKAIENTLIGDSSFSKQCSLNEEGSFETIMNVYTYVPGMQYAISASHGTLGEAVTYDREITETISFDISREADIDYPVRSVISYTWVGTVYDREGEVISEAIEPTISDRDVTLPTRVYGELKIVYMTEVNAHLLTVPPRTGDDSSENYFSSVVFAIYEGGVEYEVVSIPEELDGQFEGNGDCNTRTAASFIPPDDKLPEPPEVDGDIEEISIDYCTQELI